MMLTEEEKRSMLEESRSESLRRDMEYLHEHRANPFMVNGKVDTDKVLEFLQFYNEFLNHPVKENWEFIERDMKL
jgi:hypothetical protein